MASVDPKRAGMALAVLVVMTAVGLGGVYRQAIVTNPGDHLDRDHIRGVIAQESPVLYRDGTTRIGVFFAREHRAYVAFSDIPRAWVSAITAAEDQRFWEHGGVDVFGIARAMLRNVQAGRMVAGGSTLTQQTAKNLYYRPDRSLRSKWTELLNALRLETHYSKEEILEFYANQFHVSSNGRGLGIAARYFFDKDVAELGTLECAFLAGLVKAPSRYNPFIGKTEDDRKRAQQRARARTHYVLDRMLAEGVLTATVHADLKAKEIPFKKGTFQYDSNVILDEVEARLSQAPFPALFESLGIDNPSTAGISIVTTLDEAAQRGATHALWHHLTEMGPLLEGTPAFSAGSVMKLSYDPGRSMKPGTFHVGQAQPEAPTTIALPSGECTADGPAIQRAANVLARAESKNTWATGGRAHRDRVVARLATGGPVFVSIRANTPDGVVCDLEHRPELQGAVLVVEDGLIRAMVGGNDNRNFNRAMNARRQLGSVWKPLVYAAALQLGWSATDVVDNRSNVFHFEGTWYYPRADHENAPWTTLAWLGPRSENLGSIWLLVHLMDRLSHPEFGLVAASLGFKRAEGEDYGEYVRRIRDEHGVISTQGRLKELAFTASKMDLLDSLPTDDPETWAVRSLFYGRGIDAERQRVRDGDRVEERLAALDRSYRALAQRGTRCIEQMAALRETILPVSIDEGPMGDAAVEAGAHAGSLADAPQFEDFPDLTIDATTGVVGCSKVSETMLPLDAEAWWRWVVGEEPFPNIQEVRVDGAIRIGTLAQLHSGIKRRLLVWQGADPYDWSVLQYHPDLRTLVAMRYVDRLASAYGVREPLPPVMSLPLGAVDLSLVEAANIYQGMMDGRVPTFEADVGDQTNLALEQPALLIEEIRDRTGQTLYRSRSIPPAEPASASSRQVGDILRNVVRWGTGRRALNEVTVNGAVVPVAGKTGTTNGYRNAAFAGFVPRLDADQWAWGDGYTLMAYVGYDDNRSMRRGGVRIQGSNGALPIWFNTARWMALDGLLGLPDASTPPEWVDSAEFQRIPVDATSGLPVDGVDAEQTILAHGVWQPTRFFEPIGVDPEVAAATAARAGPRVEPAMNAIGPALLGPEDSGSPIP
ncbi:MAG: transglycosylase domain-containing protein [Myxococcota bacterium]|nr:transglycosylase domain-containing protein [Myxococcota bacterium]